MSIATTDHPVATGLCECGCGQRTSIVPRNFRTRGLVAGQPRRFVAGHNGPQANARRSPVLDEPPPADAPGARRCAGGCGYPLVPRRSQPPRGWRRHCGRDLCTRCHDRAAARDELVDFERATRTRDDVLDDWQTLRSAGLGRRKAAKRIGMSLDALNSCIFRARRDGDPRAVLGPL